jgi:hypothetical protein
MIQRNRLCLELESRAFHAVRHCREITAGKYCRGNTAGNYCRALLRRTGKLIQKREQLIQPKRLDHMLRKARFEGAPLIFFAAQGSNRDQHTVERLGAHAPRRFPTVELRHAEIQQHQVRPEGAYLVQAFGSAVANAYLTPRPAQQDSEDLRRIHVVVDNQNAKHTGL